MDQMSSARVARVLNKQDMQAFTDFLSLPENDVPMWLLRFNDSEVLDIFLLLLRGFHAAFQNWPQFSQFSQTEQLYLLHLQNMPLHTAINLVPRQNQEVYILLMHRALSAL